MTKAEALDKATKLAMKGDLALYDEILHPDYESMNQRVQINRQMSKSILFGKWTYFFYCWTNAKNL